jgi:hypothetical protein
MIGRAVAVYVGLVWAAGLMVGSFTDPPWWGCLLGGVLLAAMHRLTDELRRPRV